MIETLKNCENVKIDWIKHTWNNIESVSVNWDYYIKHTRYDSEWFATSYIVMDWIEKILPCHYLDYNSYSRYYD